MGEKRLTNLDKLADLASPKRSAPCGLRELPSAHRMMIKRHASGERDSRGGQRRMTRGPGKTLFSIETPGRRRSTLLLHTTQRLVYLYLPHAA